MGNNTFLLIKEFKAFRSNVKPWNYFFITKNLDLGEIIHILQKTLSGGLYNTYISYNEGL